MDIYRSKFEKLLEPGWIGSMRLRNRIIMPPMGTEFATEEGYVTEQMKAYYEERAKGGVALVIVEVSCVDYPRGKALRGQISIGHDKYLPGLAELAEVIKRHGAKAAIQLHHAGRSTTTAIVGCQPVAPSPIAPPGYENPRELTAEEIGELVSCYALAAERAKKAGFDGVEIHGAHLYLIAQFLSAAWNRRRDIYGGSLENRARFLLEIIKQSREMVGSRYPLWVRVNGAEYGTENGITLEETQKVARWAEKAGADAIHVSAWGEGAALYKFAIVPMTEPEGLLVPLAEGIKKVVGIPVIAVGRIRPELGEKVLRDGKADFISMGRALIADPDLPNKVIAGNLEDIRPCLSCNSCTDLRTLETGMACQVNAAAGREREFFLAPAARSRKVLVIGGGPAGIEAARVARLRGHQVTLCEKQPQLGGQLLLASIPPYKSTIVRFTDYLVRQVMKLGVEIRLQEEASPALAEQLHADVVVVATGVIPFIPPIPGIDTAKTVLAEEVLLGKEVGARVVIIGGEVVGCEVAEYLAAKGKAVTVCEVAEYTTDTGEVVKRGAFAEKTPPSLRLRLLDRLSKMGVRMLGGVKYEEIQDTGLLITTSEGGKTFLPADTIVIAAGSKPDTRLYEQLKGKVEVYLVGDCARPGRIMDAVADGHRVGHLI